MYKFASNPAVFRTAVRYFLYPSSEDAVDDQHQDRIDNAGQDVHGDDLAFVPHCPRGGGDRHDVVDADHVAAWSKGGATDISNCQMLCRPHNIAKGNK